MRRWLRDHAGVISAILLVLGICFQTGFLLREYVLPWGWRVKQVWDEPRLVRSADLSLGAKATRIISFVNQVVPDDGTILLPPGQTEARFSLSRSMQYFFFPRELIACPDVDETSCQKALASPDVYILATDDFPPQSTIDRAFVAPENDLGWFKGIYGPGFQQSGPVPRFAWFPWLGVLGTDLAVLLGLALLGGTTLVAIRPGWQPLELLGLAVPVGAGMLTLCLFLLSWSGVKLSFGLYTALLIAMTVLAGSLARSQKHRVWQTAQWRLGWDGAGGLWRVVLLGAGLGLLGLALALSVGASYRLYDPVQIWSVKGYGIAQVGSIFAGADWGVHGLAYPLNIPLQVALFFMADGDALPGSKLLYPIYGLALCGSVFSFLRRQEVDVGTAGLGALFLGSVPILFFHATSGFANLPFTFFLVSGSLWGLDGIRSGSAREQTLAGLMLGIAAWTRPEGVLYAVVVVVILAIGRALMRRGRLALAAMMAPIIVFAGVWFAFALLGNTLQGSNLQEAVSVYSLDTLSGQFDLSGLLTIGKVFAYSMFVPYRAMFPAISATYWGLLFPVVLVLMVWSARHFSWKLNPKGFVLYALWFGVGAVNVAVFYIRSYSKSNFPAFIERAFPRAFLPTAVLMTVLAFWGLGQLLKKSKEVGSKQMGHEPRET